MKSVNFSCAFLFLVSGSSALAMWSIFKKPEVSPEEYQIKLAAIENTFKACVKRCDFAPKVVITDSELKEEHKKRTEECEYQCSNEKFGNFISLNNAAKRTNGAKLTPTYDID
jgi:hypothetical protein